MSFYTNLWICSSIFCNASLGEIMSYIQNRVNLQSCSYWVESGYFNGKFWWVRLRPTGGTINVVVLVILLLPEIQGTSTLTISASAAVAHTYTTNSGSVVPCLMYYRLLAVLVLRLVVLSMYPLSLQLVLQRLLTQELNHVLHSLICTID